MITVLPERDEDRIRAAFLENGLDFKSDSGAVFAKCNDELLGSCLYYLDEKRMEILKLSPDNDLMLADGILRSAIHVACSRFVTDISYSASTDPGVFARLGFIKNEADRKLDADKLFGGCNCSGGK